MKTLKKALSIVLYVLIILVFLVAVVFVITSMNRAKSGVAAAFGYTFDAVQTNSMEDTIMVGDIVVGKAVDAEKTELKLGDIVTYRTTIEGIETTKTHRITKVEGGENGSITFFETWGDNRNVCPVADDGMRTIYDIVSYSRDDKSLEMSGGDKVGFVIPKVGKFIDFLKKPAGFILCVVVPLLAFIAWEIIDLVKLYNRIKKNSLVAEAVTEASEDVKDAIIREYLAKQAAEAAAKGEAPTGGTPPSNSENNQK